MSFQAGDVVYLKSGGPAMTVRWVNENTYLCEWFVDNQDLKGEKFLGTSLTNDSPSKKPVSPPVKNVSHF